jgi:transposase
MTVKITRLDHSSAELRQQAAQHADSKVTRRLLAIALILEGDSRADAARSCGMDRQTLRDWVIRYNEKGIDGLCDQPHGGGTGSKLTEAEKAALAKWVENGPDPKEDGLVRWRLSDLSLRIRDRFFVLLDERSVSRIIKAMGFSHISVRPRHPQADVAAQEAHKKTLPRWLPKPSHRRPATSPSNYGGRTKQESASKAA